MYVLYFRFQCINFPFLLEFYSVPLDSQNNETKLKNYNAYWITAGWIRFQTREDNPWGSPPLDQAIVLVTVLKPSRHNSSFSRDNRRGPVPGEAGDHHSNHHLCGHTEMPLNRSRNFIHIPRSTASIVLLDYFSTPLGHRAPIQRSPSETSASHGATLLGKREGWKPKREGRGNKSSQR